MTNFFGRVVYVFERNPFQERLSNQWLWSNLNNPKDFDRLHGRPIYGTINLKNDDLVSRKVISPTIEDIAMRPKLKVDLEQDKQPQKKRKTEIAYGQKYIPLPSEPKPIYSCFKIECRKKFNKLDDMYDHEEQEHTMKRNYNCVECGK